MRYWLALPLVLLLPLTVAAQEERGFFGRLFGGGDEEVEEEGGGFLERQIENALSGAGREVTVTGFEGALSSRATLRELTIADDEGVWLTLRDVVLDWNRSALLRRRVQIEELAAGEILLPRLPAPQESQTVDVPSPEAQGFSLPELPVAIQIGRLDAQRVEIGEPVFGEAAVVTLEGELSLAGGAGAADIAAERIDGEEGRLSLEASYDNESEELAVDVALAEGPDGIAATLIDLPGRPSLELTAAGAGPLSDFEAQIALETDGEPRLAGTVTLGETEAGGRSFAADLGGDVAPVFLPEYQDFFGRDVALSVSGATIPDGGTRIDALSLTAEALQLQGEAAIGADGLPDLIDVSGRIASGDGSAVLLPLSGPPTRLQSATLDVAFDASVSDEWSLDLVVDSLDREGFDAARVAIDGTGRISTDGGRSVTADLDFAASDLSLADGGAQQALGEEVTGRAVLAWTEGEPLVLDLLTVDGETYGLDAGAEVTFGDALNVEGQAALSARDLSAFSALAQRPLEGSAEVTLAGAGDPLAGQFTLALDGTTQDLQVGVPQVDPLLDGTGTVTIRTERSDTGTRIETLRIETPQLTAEGGGVLATGSSEVQLTASVAETSLIADSLSGPATFDVSAQEVASGWSFDVDAQASGADIAAEGTVDLESAAPVVAADFDVSAEDLAAFSDLAQRELGGALTASGAVRTGFDLESASIDATVSGTDLRIGDPRIDPLLDGPVDISIDATRSGDTVVIEAFRLDAPDAEASVEGRVENLTQAPVFDGQVVVSSPDLAPFSAIAGRDLDGSVDATASGTLAFDLSNVDMTVDATATDLDPGVPGAEAALAGRTTLGVEASYDGERAEIARLDLSNPQISASGTGTLTGLDAAPTFEGDMSISAPDLAPFSGLAGRDLSGSFQADYQGIVATDLSAVDASLRARGQDIDLGLPGEPIFPGQMSLDVAASRQGDTVTLSELSLQSENLTAEGGGQITDVETTPVFDGQISLAADTLEPFGGLAGIPLSGAISAGVSGSVATDLSEFDVSADARAQDLRIGQADADRLLAGTTTLDIGATRSNGVTRITAAELDASGFDLSASGSLGEAGAEVDLSARLADIGPYAPGFSGPVTVAGTVAQQGDVVRLDLDASGPGGIAAAVGGSVALAGPTLDLEITGQAPLAAANRFVQPRALAGTAQFDLALNGAPGLDALSGTVTTGDARFVDPTFGIVLEGIDLAARLNAGTLSIDADAGVQAGGSVGVGGTVGLAGNLPADLNISLNGAVLQDPELYKTSVSGDIAFNGPLRGGGNITGELALGETEIRVPSTGAGAGGPIPEITHIGESGAVRETRRRAGLLRQAMDGTETLQERRRVAHSLNIGIRANNRIFVRGRGLDAELGGALRIRGTTANIIPAGQFELVRGRLDILGQRLTLDEGNIRLQGDFVPFIRLVAATEAGDINVFVILEGRISAPDIDFLSEPELPEDEVLARLLFGRSIQDISPLQAAQLASAVATLSGGGGPGIADRIRQNFGLDDLDLTTSDGGGTAVRAGKYLTENIYTDITVDSEGETELNLNFDVTDSFTVKGGVTNDGGSSLGVFFERDY